jgi:hypothetical protein
MWQRQEVPLECGGSTPLWSAALDADSIGHASSEIRGP